MGNTTTFSISLPEDEQRKLDSEAKRMDRSRAAQVRVILKEWFAKNEVVPISSVKREKQ